MVEGEWLFHPDSHSQALALEALLREALTNIAKHARATNVTLRLQTSATHVLLEVEDDGRGFDPEKLRDSTMGFTSMRERVKLLGTPGELELRSERADARDGNASPLAANVVRCSGVYLAAGRCEDQRRRLTRSATAEGAGERHWRQPPLRRQLLHRSVRPRRVCRHLDTGRIDEPEARKRRR